MKSILQITAVDFFLLDCETRLPFRFGISTMERAPMVTARARIRLEDGQESVGFSSDLCVPRWFDKDPSKTLRQDVMELLKSCELAAESSQALAPASVFALWMSLYAERVASVPLSSPDRLVRGFGVALVERAVMDATCRARPCSFFDALQEDLFGFEPGLVHEELSSWDFKASLPVRPPSEIHVRHTVGLLDPLDESEPTPAPDGLPFTLRDDIRVYGLKHFKLKVQGDLDSDLARLGRIGEILGEECAVTPFITLDGNEQYSNAADLCRVLERLGASPSGKVVSDNIQYIEQPLQRGLSLMDSAREGVRELSQFAPVIIDESDFGIEAFPLALELGYRGVSIKNCKGVFRSMLNRGLCQSGSGDRFQSGEDLTNLPVIPLQQDLCTMSALGITNVERNGHHYFRGLDHLPTSEQSQALARHEDLYARTGNLTHLRIQEGAVQLGSIHCAGYGFDFAPDMTERESIAAWTTRHG